MNNALMLGMAIWPWIVGGVVLLVILWVIGTYNRLVALRTAVRAAWGHIDVQLKRRYDLIPNLVETVRGYAGHEKETLERVISARRQAVAAAGPAQTAAAENMLTGALRQLFALSEAYPDLKANQTFQQLQGELANTENMIGGARQRYNHMVESYNVTIAQFPAVIVATLFGYREEEFFEITAASEREAPRVSFQPTGRDSA
jgi:LemA protein